MRLAEERVMREWCLIKSVIIWMHPFRHVALPGLKQGSTRGSGLDNRGNDGNNIISFVRWLLHRYHSILLFITKTTKIDLRCTGACDSVQFEYLGSFYRFSKLCAMSSQIHPLNSPSQAPMSHRKAYDDAAMVHLMRMVKTPSVAFWNVKRRVSW